MRLNSSGTYSTIINHFKEVKDVSRDIEINQCAIGYILYGSCSLKQDDKKIVISEKMLYLLEPGRHTIDIHIGRSGTFELLIIYLQRPNIDKRNMRLYEKEEHRFNKALFYGLSENMTIEDMADLCCFSASTFKRRFRARYSHSPHKWFLHYRLDIAYNILNLDDIPTHEIARICGFVNTSHFIATFKRYFGTTPSRFRRSQQQDDEEEINAAYECENEGSQP